MVKFLFAVFNLVLFLNVHSQIIPTARIADWNNAGYPGEIPDPALVLDITSFGAIPDGITPVNPFLTLAIDSLGDSFGVIYFPPGDYLITASITLSDSIILRGASSDSTKLIFDFNGAPADCIDISRNQTNQFTKVLLGFEKGSVQMEVLDSTIFSAEDYAELRQQNGTWDTKPESYADYSVGQFLKIISVSGNELIFESALRMDYDTSLNLEIRKIVPVKNVGIECMSIFRRDSSSTASIYNINFQYAAACWVKGVESAKSMGSHIMIEQSSQVQVTGCFIHHSFGYDGVGTRGYGVTLRQHASDCLVENNIFQFLRHAMMVKEGANGNVFGYNYSLEPNRSEPIANFSGDISVHGHYPFANLFEGNIVQNIIIDHARGQAGPYNTFLRNRAELYGIIITPDSFTTSNQNFIGNETININSLFGNYILSGTGHFEYGNNIKGVVLPVDTNYLPDSSYYLHSVPEFWSSGMNYPSIGIPLAINSGNLTAKERFLAGTQLTVCSIVQDTLATSMKIEGEIFEVVKVFPNPFAEKLNLEFKIESEQSTMIVIRNMFGEILSEKYFQLSFQKNSISLSFDKMQNGFYLVDIKSDSFHSVHKVYKLIQ